MQPMLSYITLTHTSPMRTTHPFTPNLSSMCPLLTLPSLTTGALPPPSAGLVASAAEEEISEGASITASFVRVDAWARSVPPPYAPPPGTLIPFGKRCESPQFTAQQSGSSFSQNLQSPGESAGPGGSSAAPPPPPPPTPGDGSVLVTLASRLASVCDGQQLQIARVMGQWVSGDWFL